MVGTGTGSRVVLRFDGMGFEASVGCAYANCFKRQISSVYGRGRILKNGSIL